MSDKLPKKVKVPKALRKAGLETLLETSKGRAILAEALMAAAQAAAAVLTAPRKDENEPAAKTGDTDKAQPAAQSGAAKRSVAIAPASRRRVGRPRTMPPAIAADKAPSPPARITPTQPAAGRKAAGTPVPRQRAAAPKGDAKTTAAPSPAGSVATASANAPTTPGKVTGKATTTKPAARRGRPRKPSGTPNANA